MKSNTCQTSFCSSALSLFSGRHFIFLAYFRWASCCQKEWMESLADLRLLVIKCLSKYKTWYTHSYLRIFFQSVNFNKYVCFVLGVTILELLISMYFINIMITIIQMIGPLLIAYVLFSNPLQITIGLFVYVLIMLLLGSIGFFFGKFFIV